MTTATNASRIPTTAQDAVERAEMLAARFALTAAQHDADSTFPTEHIEPLFQSGLLVLTMPKGAGGAGFGIAVARKVIETIATGEPTIALSLEMTFGHHARMADRWPSAVVERLRAESLVRPTLFNSARVEPALGTPARGGMPVTHATRTGDGWVINGHKLYATGSPGISYFMVWAKTDDHESKVGYFLVPKASPGISLLPTWDHIGMRATRSDDLILEDVAIPADHALDIRLPVDWGPASSWEATWNALAIGSVYQGVARSARDWLVRYLNERKPANLGASLATLPRFQLAVGEIESKLVANDILLTSVAEAAEAAVDAGLASRANVVKSAVTRNAAEAVRLGLELTGNPGLSRNNPLERHYRNVLCGPVHTPQDDMTFGALGKAALAAYQ